MMNPSFIPSDDPLQFFYYLYKTAEAHLMPQPFAALWCLQAAAEPTLDRFCCSQVY